MFTASCARTRLYATNFTNKLFWENEKTFLFSVVATGEQRERIAFRKSFSENRKSRCAQSSLDYREGTFNSMHIHCGLFNMFGWVHLFVSCRRLGETYSDFFLFPHSGVWQRNFNYIYWLRVDESWRSLFCVIGNEDISGIVEKSVGFD